jgi:branched-chain amino acid transport system permease protein
MAEAVGTAIRARASENRLGGALRDAILTGLIAFLLFIVIVGLKTENAQEKLVLVPRLGWALFWAMLAVAGKLLIDLFLWRGSHTRASGEPFVSPAVALIGLALAYAFGAYFFIVPGAREMLATSAGDIFGAEEWRARIRIAVDLTGFTLLAVFVVVTAMLLMLALRRVLASIGVESVRTRAQSFFGELGAQFAPALLLIALVLPLLVVGPQQRYAIDTAIQVLMYIMLGWGLNIVVGLAGLLDLGYVAFYAVGAYTFALLGTTFGLSFWICLPLAGLFAALWGIMLGFPVLRLRGDYLAIVTLAFGEIIRIVLLNWFSLTNGPNGISRIPRMSFFGLTFERSGEHTFHDFFGLEYNPIYRIIFTYYVILLLALLVNFATTRLRRLPLGRAWEALREDEIACRSLGINTTTTKLTAFAIGAMFAGFAGSFFATRQGFISPESFTFQESALVLAIVVLGGLGSQIGIVIAAIVLIGTGELFRDLEEYRMLIFGASMMAIMITRPRGLVSSRTPSVALKERRAISSDLVKEGHG